MKQKRGVKKFLSVLNSKPVIGALIFIMLSLATVFAGNIIAKEGNLVVENNLNVSGRITDQTGFVTPVGSINAYAGSTAPQGWLLCNGSAISRTTYADLYAIIGTTYGAGDGSTTFNLPDLRGIFVRGAGTSGKLSEANASLGNFSATLGTYQNDSFQGHGHQVLRSGGSGSSPSTTQGSSATSGATIDWTYMVTAIAPVTDTINGVPRTGAETSPASLGLNYIIKY